MAQLRFTNKIVDNIRLGNGTEEKEKDIKGFERLFIKEALLASFRKGQTRDENVMNTNLTGMNTDHKMALYKALRGIVGC